METQRTCPVCGAGLVTVDLVGVGFVALRVEPTLDRTGGSARSHTVCESLRERNLC
jgi:hypothetical protein